MPEEQSKRGSIENPVHFKDQDFTTLLEQCLKSGALFSDPTFTADMQSIGMPEDPDPKKAIKWLRPKNICKNAVFVEGTIGTTDICQGQLGDCWLLAALSCLTMHPQLFGKVVPAEQSLSESYAGIFHFRFWQYGEWVEVTVDDRLPVREGRLLFSYSRTRNEYWSALVEKAYAKLIGSYSSLKGGNISEGMEDFTGGIAYSLPVAFRTPPVLWRALTDALSRGSLLSCFIQAKSNLEIGKVTGDGLVKGHAYAITDSDKVKKASGDTLLLRLRNPWGFVEYSGPWSDKSKEWDDVDGAEIQRIEVLKQDDGEFWIGVEDFSKLFNTVELCSVSPDNLEESDNADSSSVWTITEHKGSWVPGSSAGGPSGKNPQFELILTDHDHPVDSKNSVKQCTVLVELLQVNRRKKSEVNFLNMAFNIYKVPLELQGVCLNLSFFTKNRPVVESGKYQAQRAVWKKVQLDCGVYVIVPSTNKANLPGEFFLRIFSKTGNTLGRNDFTCSSHMLMVTSNPVSPEDHVNIHKLFDDVAGPDDRLDANELMKLINSVLEKDYQLPLDTCRQLIFLEDHCCQTNGRCTLSREQTETLLPILRHLQSIFLQYDEDSPGTMSPYELSLALQAAGMQCDGKVVEMLWERFGSGDLLMPFHVFVSCTARLRKLFALYESETSPEVKDRGINAWLLQLIPM